MSESQKPNWISEETWEKVRTKVEADRAKHAETERFVSFAILDARGLMRIARSKYRETPNISHHVEKARKALLKADGMLRLLGY